jgi:spore coat protein U-like protein
MKRLLILLMVFGMIFVFSNVAYSGQTKTASMDVSAFINTYCSLSTLPVQFGEYTPIGGNTAVGWILLNCNNTPTLTMAIDGGTAGGPQRYLAGTTTTDTLEYELYKNSGHTNIWGGNFYSTGSSKVRAYDNQDVTHGGFHGWAVYGKIPGGQGNKDNADYVDTVNVTVIVD